MTIVPTCGDNFIIYSLTGTIWANTIYELADPYNSAITSVLNCATLGNCFTISGLLSVKLCHAGRNAFVFRCCDGP